MGRRRVRGRDKDRGRTVFEEEERVPSFPSFGFAKRKKDSLVARSKLSPGNIFKFPPSTERLLLERDFQERPIRRNSLYESGKTLETSKLVIDFSFT